jgi:hypothetical protein
MFCSFADNTFLSFVAFHNPLNPEKNRGAIFRDGIAKSFFEYYEEIADKYKDK